MTVLTLSSYEGHFKAKAVCYNCLPLEGTSGATGTAPPPQSAHRWKGSYVTVGK